MTYNIYVDELVQTVIRTNYEVTADSEEEAKEKVMEQWENNGDLNNLEDEGIELIESEEIYDLQKPLGRNQVFFEDEKTPFFKEGYDIDKDEE